MSSHTPIEDELEKVLNFLGDLSSQADASLSYFINTGNGNIRTVEERNLKIREYSKEAREKIMKLIEQHDKTVCEKALLDLQQTRAIENSSYKDTHP